MDRFQQARLIAPAGAIETALKEIVRLYGHAEPVEPLMDLLLQALTTGPAATEAALDEIIYWCGRRDGEVAEA